MHTRDEDLEADYGRVRDEEKPLVGSTSPSKLRSHRPLSKRFMVVLTTLVLSTLAVFFVLGRKRARITIAKCADGAGGYQCHPEVSHYWGQYSPFFSLQDQSEINPAIPPQCNVTFVQVLSRHGARYPTASKSKKYAKLVDRIQQTATEYKDDAYAVLKTYRYSLGADELTGFGEQQMLDSGTQFYHRYKQLARQNVPFIRASRSSRVIESGDLFSKAFNNAKKVDSGSNSTQKPSSVDLVIPEGRQWNNTLDTSTCESFADDSPVSSAEKEFLGVFAPSILERLVSNMPGVDLNLKDVPLLMDLCPFETVAQKDTKKGNLSPLCDLFTPAEWQSYDYYKSIGKYYEYGAGNPLASTRGVGYVNEIIARMTKTLPVQDHTSVNHTLDSDPDTFPLDTALYADFSHDNAMNSIFDSFGLYNATAPLSTTHVQPANETKGYAASWVVPFASRAYFEVMQCSSSSPSHSNEKINGKEDEHANEPLVRVLINDRVVPLHGCIVDDLGRCRLDDWIDGLDFARNGGRWDDYCQKPDDFD